MKRFSSLALCALLVTALGCASGAVAPFRAIDLDQNLDAHTLERFQSELELAVAAGQTGHLLNLEHRDWRLLGLLGYWNKGGVQAIHSAEGYHFVVSKTQGWGPLAILWASKREATFDPRGKRKSLMGMDSIGWGHLAMLHTMGSALDDEHWMEHQSYHLAHHMLNFGKDHNGLWFSFGSAPNPVGFRP